MQEESANKIMAEIEASGLRFRAWDANDIHFMQIDRVLEDGSAGKFVRVHSPLALIKAEPVACEHDLKVVWYAARRDLLGEDAA